MNKSAERAGERRQWVWIMLMVNVVFILLLTVLGILALRVGNTLPENTDIIFVVGKSPSVEIGDAEENGGKKWEAGKRIDIFKADYVDGEGRATVASQDGEKLFAPGTAASYTFTVMNNGNMAVVCETDIDFFLTVGNEGTDIGELPFKVRLYNSRGEYLIGGEDEWVKVGEATMKKHVSVLGASSYDNCTLDILWDYDGGSDELDTQLGDRSAAEGITLTLRINSYAEEAPEPTLKGGTRVDVADGSDEVGGTVRWLWLVLLMINTAILVFYIAWLMNKRQNKF